MLDRARARIEDQHTVYLTNKGEEELQFEDYFETDLEIESQNENCNKIQNLKAEILDDP